LAIGEAVGVDALDEVVAGGGDEDRSSGDVEGCQSAGGLGHAHDEGIDVGDAHDGGEGVDPGASEIGDSQLRGDEHAEEQGGEEEGCAQFEGIGWLELSLQRLSGGVGTAGPEPTSGDREEGKDEEGHVEDRHQLTIEEREQDSEAEIHDSGGDEDAAGEEVGMLLLFGAAGHDDGGDRGGVGAAEEGGEDDAAGGFGELLEDVAAVGDGADGNDDEPGSKGIDVEAGELLTREDRENDAGEKEELGEGEDFARGNAAGEFLECGFEVEQEQAGDTEGGGDPEVSIANQSAHEEGGESGHFGGDAGDVGFGELVPVGEEHESGDDEEAEGEGEKLVAAEQGEGVAEEADEGEGADSAEGIGAGLGFVVFALESDEEGKEEDEDDLDGVGREVGEGLAHRGSVAGHAF